MMPGGRRRIRAWVVAVAAAPVGLIAVVVFIVLAGGGGCLSSPGSLSEGAQAEIPPDITAIYLAMAGRWNIDVAFLASIGAQETDHGRSPATNAVNGAGCEGLMQLGVGGRCGDFWGRNACDGNGDGAARITDPWDNVCAAAHGLRAEKGAPPGGGSAADYERSACNYYGDRTATCAYGDEVMARAVRYGFVGGTATDATRFAGLAEQSATGCSAGTATSGAGRALVIDPGANRAGVPLTLQFTTFAARIAALLPRPLVLTTGTNHSELTSTGNISDHWTGNAGDFASSRNGFPDTGGGYGDQIAATALVVAGASQADAARMAAAGGAFTLTNAGLRVQVIWKSLIGGNHYNHVHVGIKPVGAAPTPAEG